MRARAGRIAAAVCAALGVVAAPAHARAITVDVGQALAHVSLVAEVTVLEVETGAWMGRGDRLGKVRVRVTEDLARVFAGFDRIGTTLELTPARTGPYVCAEQLRPALAGGPVLLVVDADGTILLGGPVAGTGYDLRGWCDHNACLLSHTEGFAAAPREGDNGHELHVTRAELAARYRDVRAAFCARVTRFLDGEPPALTEAALTELVEELAADDRARREHAQLELAARGALSVTALRAAARQATDPEVRRLLEATLSQMKEDETAAAVAARLAKGPAAARRQVVRQSLAALEGESRARAERYLAQLYRED